MLYAPSLWLTRTDTSPVRWLTRISVLFFGGGVVAAGLAATVSLKPVKSWSTEFEIADVRVRQSSHYSQNRSVGANVPSVGKSSLNMVTSGAIVLRPIPA